MSKSKGEAAMTSDKTATDQVKVVFTPSGGKDMFSWDAGFDRGTPAGVDIDSVCGGRAMCGRSGRCWYW